MCQHLFMSANLEILRGGGNVFADFGDTDADVAKMKATIAAEIIAALNAQGLTARAGAKAAQIDAADIQRIRNADLSKFTVDRLVRVAARLGCALEITVKPGAARDGGNIFADLGLPDADRHFLKAQLVAELYRLSSERKLTPAKASKLLGVSKGEISSLFKGNFREYPVDRLMTFLTAFSCDVEIVSRASVSQDGRGKISFQTIGAQNHG